MPNQSLKLGMNLGTAGQMYEAIGFLLIEDGTHLLNEDGTSFFILE